MVENNRLDKAFDGGAPSTIIAQVAGGQESLILSQLAGNSVEAKGLVHVCSNPQQLQAIVESIGFFAPWLETIVLPAWDCLPYDRVSPSTQVIADRIEALNRIASAEAGGRPLLVLTTANALLQRNVPRHVLADQQTGMAPGKQLDMDVLTQQLSADGFERVPTVRERGEFAVRGGILDIFVPGSEEPVRLDFFGDTLESIRTFDPASQRTTGQLHSFSLNSMSEITLNTASVQRFRQNYLEMFGAATRDDALYLAVSEARRFAGMEHWLPLFYEGLETLFAYAEGFNFSHANDLAEAVTARDDQIRDYYEARQQAIEQKIEGGTPYKPVPPGHLYLNAETAMQSLQHAGAVAISPFDQPESSQTRVISVEGRAGRNFAIERSSGQNVFDALADHVGTLKAAGKKILLAAWSEGSLDRLSQVLEEHAVAGLKTVANYGEFTAAASGTICIAVLPIEQGFETATETVIAEQDILGDRLVRRSGRKRDKDFIKEAATLSEGGHRCACRSRDRTFRGASIH